MGFIYCYNIKISGIFLCVKKQLLYTTFFACIAVLTAVPCLMYSFSYEHNLISHLYNKTVCNTSNGKYTMKKQFNDQKVGNFFLN